MVYIRNFTSTKINKKFLKKIVEIVFKNAKIKNKNGAEIGIAIVGSGQMRNLNNKYRGKNRATDVLAFSAGKSFSPIQDKTGYLGDIVICLPVAKKQAKVKRHSLKKEMTILLIHGILHLLRYDHEKSKRKAERMEKIEMKLLRKYLASKTKI